MTPEEARQQTIQHIHRVAQLLGVIASEIKRRAVFHDVSKLSAPESEMFAQVTETLKRLTYGSEEYEKQRQQMLGLALGHHYEHNSHHPEHFANGVSGMSLVDLVEMLCDWRAATERHADGDIHKSIEINTERFGLSEQLAQIFKNTVSLLE